MQEVRIQGTTNFFELENAHREAMSDFDNPSRVNGVCLEGSSRSGKTFGISMFFCNLLNKEQGNVVTISRDFLNTLKNTTYKSFEKVWNAFRMPPGVFNKSATDIRHNSNLIRFVGINDNIGKAHGMEQDYLWINEAIFVQQNSFDQMEQRTSKFWVLDYNPSEEKSWIYNVADKRKDVKLVKTTFLDNPLAPNAEVRKILSYNPWHPEDEKLKEEERRPHPKNITEGTANRFNWLVYGKGLRSAGEDRIYNFELFEDFPEDYDWKMYGLDFGFSNDVSAVCEVVKQGHKLYVKEIIYEIGLVTISPSEEGEEGYVKNLADRIIKSNIDKNCYVVCDNQRPDSIAQLRLKGINAIPCRKGKGSIKGGIDTVKGYMLYYHVTSMNLQTEGRGYKWMRDKVSNVRLNIPIDKENHLMDAKRYAVTKVLQ